MPLHKRISKTTVKRIMVFGTFDMVHPGHSNMFEQARKLAKHPYLIVSIARDKNVMRIKGEPPKHSETKRAKLVKANPLVDKVVLGGIRDHLPHIIREKPDIIALGYDQEAYVKGLNQQLKNAGLSTKVMRLKPYQPHIYKTSLLKNKPV